MFENRNIVVLKTNFVLFLSAGTEQRLTRGNQQDGLHQFHLQPEEGRCGGRS